MDTPIIKIQGLAYSYDEAGKRQNVLRNVNLSIGTGETVALVGASGSGKSTLLNLLGGIDRPSEGDIVIKGESITTMKEPDLTLFRRDHIGFIYQLFNLIPTLTVAENTALPLELSAVPAKQRISETERWLELVGLQDRRDAFPDQLSGGEQQRVAIARALIHQPAIVLADEPTGNLDAATGRGILDLLMSLAEKNNQTLLVVTHSREVARRTRRILLMQSGSVSDQYGEDQISAW